MHAARTVRMHAAVLGAAIACGAADAQFLDPGAKPPPITLPRMRQPGTEPFGGGRNMDASEGVAYLSFGMDAAVGVVAPTAVPPADSLAIVVDASPLAVADLPGVLVLADGQRIPGRIEKGVATGPDDAKPSAVWSSPWRAPIPLSTDGIRAILLSAGAAIPSPGDADLVVLRNGDRVTGVVTSIDTGTVTIEQGSGADAKRVPLEMSAVAAMALVGPPMNRSGARVWLVDGTVLDGPAEWRDAAYLVMPGVPGLRTPNVTVPRRQVVAVQSAPDALVPLAALQPTATTPAAARDSQYATPSPTVLSGTWGLDAATVEIEGPVVLRYPAAASPRRLVAEVRRPATARAAGDVELVVSAGGKELAHERFDAQRAHASLRVDLPAGEFEVELRATKPGNAGCFVVLERALLLRR